MKQFKLTQNTDTGGTHLQKITALVPSELVAKFGKPARFDGYKVSGAFVFSDQYNGNVFTLYDWKSTSLYSNSEERPSEFWSASTPREIHIGGRGDPASFIGWLEEEMKEVPKTKE